MVSNQNSPTLTDFVEKNYELIRKVELYSEVLFIIGFILYKLQVPQANLVLILGIICSALSCFLQAFGHFEPGSNESPGILGTIGFLNFILKLYYFSLSVSIMALLGFVIDFKKGNSMIAPGGITLLLALIFTFFARFENKSKLCDSRFYLRSLICLGFIVYMVLTKGGLPFNS